MPYAIHLKPSVAKQIRGLPRPMQRRIAGTIDALATDPRPAGCTKLTGVDSLYRVRVGDYRILYRVMDRELVVLVMSVGHRREVYR